MSPLAIYLRNHEAAASAGYDLFRRASANQRKKPYAAELTELAAEVRDDLDALRRIMGEVGVQPDPVLGTLLRVGERIGRLKPNGHLLTRAPLSDLIEVEGLLDAVRAKWAGWQALAAAGGDDWADTVDLTALITRADSQIERLVRLHRLVAGDVLHRPSVRR
jgi:hypothetical protein